MIMWIAIYTKPNKNLLVANRLEPVISPSSIFRCMKFLNLFIECWGPVKYDGKKNTWLAISKTFGTSLSAFNFWSLLNDSWNIIKVVTWIIFKGLFAINVILKNIPVGKIIYRIFFLFKNLTSGNDPS